MCYTLALIVLMVSMIELVEVEQLSCQMQVDDHLKGKAVKPWF